MFKQGQFEYEFLGFSKKGLGYRKSRTKGKIKWPKLSKHEKLINGAYGPRKKVPISLPEVKFGKNEEEKT